MTMDFCSKNPTSELEPCKEPALQESLKGLSLEEKKEKIAAAIGAVELKRKKKIAIIMHDVRVRLIGARALGAHHDY